MRPVTEDARTGLERLRQQQAELNDAATARGVRPITNDTPDQRLGSHAEDDPLEHAEVAALEHAARQQEGLEPDPLESGETE